MTIIDKFINQYKREYDFYDKISSKAKEIIQERLSEAWIIAIVTSRAKSLDSLKNKIEKIHSETPFKRVDTIRNNIKDLSWVRIALYFPSDKEKIEELINKDFRINDIKIHTNHKESDTWYWATHYLVDINKVGTNKRYKNSLIEIQVASVLMHAWSEVEHDLIYKEKNWKATKNEIKIIDEINEIVKKWEDALERLNLATEKRIKEDDKITSSYDLNHIIKMYYKENEKFKDIYKTIDSWNLKKLNTFIQEFNKNLPIHEVRKSIDNIYNTISITIDKNKFNTIPRPEEINTDKFLIFKEFNLSDKVREDLIINDIINNWTQVDNYLKVNHNKSYISDFEKFIKLWNIFEESIDQLVNEEHGTKKLKRMSKMLDKIGLNGFNDSKINDINELRIIRNDLVHWTSKITNLKKYINKVESLVNYSINKIKNDTIKVALLNKLNKLSEE